MNPRIQELITAGESRTVEFKTARSALSRDLYETVCAFLNRDGGDILLGVKNDGTVHGVDPDCVVRMKEEFATAINNPQKLNPPCYLSLQAVDHDGLTLLHLAVPPSSQVHRCANRIYDRNEDGDFDITNNNDLVTQLYVRKQSHYTENTIYPYATLADLRPELIGRARRMVGMNTKNHPWAAMDDNELLTSARLFQRDYQRNVEGMTLAAILLFGKDTTILSVLPHHKTDAIVRRVDADRYDDRDDIRTNLLESYDRLVAFGEKHLSDPFYQEGLHRISLRSHILREIMGNLLIHREYSNAFPAKFVIERGRLFTENANRPHGHGPIDPSLFSPYPKNPVIARVFKEIGLADELGSGVRRLFKYCKTYCGHDPELIEGDVFSLRLALSEAVSPTSVTGLAETSGKASGKTEKASGKTSGRILEILRQDSSITIPELAARLDVTERSIERNIHNLRESGHLRRVGPAKGGHWEVLK